MRHRLHRLHTTLCWTIFSTLCARSCLQLWLSDASCGLSSLELEKLDLRKLSHIHFGRKVSSPAATPGSGPASAAAKVDADAAEAPPAEVQAAYVAQYMATVARLAAARGGAGDQKKPDLGGTACLIQLHSHFILRYFPLS